MKASAELKEATESQGNTTQGLLKDSNSEAGKAQAKIAKDKADERVAKATVMKTVADSMKVKADEAAGTASKEAETAKIDKD